MSCSPVLSIFSVHLVTESREQQHLHRGCALSEEDIRRDKMSLLTSFLRWFLSCILTSDSLVCVFSFLSESGYKNMNVRISVIAILDPIVFITALLLWTKHAFPCHLCCLYVCIVEKGSFLCHQNCLVFCCFCADLHFLMLRVSEANC